jgi:death on curing protein
MFKPRFLNVSEIIEIHDQELIEAGGISGIRDMGMLESAAGAPQASFGGHFLMNIFEMATTYVNSIALNHPFLDGNKRTAAASALTFLYLNGYDLDENYEEELADKIIELVIKKIDKNHLTQYFQTRTKIIE